MANNHTILLYQQSKSQNTRQWSEFPSKQEAMDGVCKLYEAQLKRLNPNVKFVQYEVKDLFQFLDELADISCLVYDTKINAYVPYGREWIKKSALNRLKQISQKK